MRTLLFLLAGLFFYQCGSTKKEEIPDGGACIYDTTILPATLVNLSLDSANTKIRYGFTFKGGDTLFDQIEKSALESAYHLKDTAIHIGDIFQFWELNTTSGACATQHKFTFNAFKN